VKIKARSENKQTINIIIHSEKKVTDFKKKQKQQQIKNNKKKKIKMQS